MKSLQQAAQEFFDECVRNGVATESVRFKSIHITDFTGDHYLFQSADIDGKIVGVKSDKPSNIAVTICDD